MLVTLESTARRHAVAAAVRSIVAFAILIAPWFVRQDMSLALPWGWVVGIALLLPTLAVLLLPLEKVADRLVRHLRPQAPPRQFENVVSEIAIALNEPVESIQAYDCPIPNVAMLPCSKGEIVVATTGAFDRLSRHELQALVAAQFAGMRDRWCRLATRAEILWWAIPWCLVLFAAGAGVMHFLTTIPGLDTMARPAVFIVSFMALFPYVFLPRHTEQARDLCADVAAVRTTFDPQSLGNAMRKLAERAGEAIRIDFGTWYLPTNPFLVIPRRAESRTTVSTGSGSRSWTTSDEVRLELQLRADRAEALAEGADPSDYTGREFRRRWGRLGR